MFARARDGAAGDPGARRHVHDQAEAELTALCRPWLEPRVPQTPLCTRILRHLAYLFVFVTDPDVPPTNNAAERSLRHLVVCRKISGGTRSERGTDVTMALASLFGTWRLQDINPFTARRDLLASPQV